MPSIRSIGTAVPSLAHSKSDVLDSGAVWLADQPELLAKFERFVKKSNTVRRHFAVPAPELLALGDQAERADLFIRHGMRLASEAIRRCLEHAKLGAAEVGAIVATSCTAPLIPSLDSMIVHQLGFSERVFRIPIYQQGCAGGVVGLSLASRLVASSGPVLLSSTELCSLLFHTGDVTGAQLVGSAIFADGAAALLLTDQPGGLQILATHCHLLPETTHLMGYDICKDGPHLRLDRDLPKAVSAAVPQIIERFLHQHNLIIADVPWWLFHPGGEKILQMLESGLGLAADQCSWGREVLTQFGNMSSASVLFVLDAFIRSGAWRDGDRAVLVGIGPGITIELALLQCTSA